MSSRDLELVQLILRYRDYQRAVKRLAGIPILLEKLRKVWVPPSPAGRPSPHPCTQPGSRTGLARAPLTCPLSSLQAQDFYVEMKWEFTSWGE